ncbi:MAG TPA: flagellar hook-basal body complex protein, partial [Desulfobacteria bacterium]|nr:flagellar hook-basal body complex protein [Desulfobacteria bacterium]
MIQSLWSASSGMQAQQLSLDNVANNMANVNTPGFKKSRVDFQDLLYSEIREPDRMTRMGQVVTNGIQIGSGARPSSTQLIFEQGSIQQTGNPMDIAISGNAFFEVTLPDGSKAYTRDGSFKVDSKGYLVTGGGYRSSITSANGELLTFEKGSSNINIDEKGVIFRDGQELGRINLAHFTNPAGLGKIGSNLYLQTVNSGAPQDAADYTLNSGALEMSNVQ